MRRPSDCLPANLSGRLRGNLGLLGLGMLTLALGEAMRAHAGALNNQAAPHGILSLQFTCAVEAAAAILASWDAEALSHARLSLLWDMGFAPAYGLALAALTERIAETVRPGGRRPAFLAWLPIWAALADWLENLCHLCLISADRCGAAAVLPPLACGFALLKWGLLSAWLPGISWLGLRGLRASTSKR
jgi:hypothetical protein